MRGRWVFSLAILLCGSPGLLTSAHAQTASPSARATPALSTEHWALDALTRWEALGLLPPGYLPPTRSVPTALVAEMLDHAARASDGDPLHEAPTRAALERFRDEFPEAIATGGDGRVWSGVGARHRRASDVDLPVEAPSLKPLSDRSHAYLSGGAVLRPVERIALSGQLLAAPRSLTVQQGAITAMLGAMELSAGRQAVGYGFARGGGVTLSSAPLDRLQLQTVRSLLLPGPLRLIGPVGGQLFLSRLGGSRHPDEPVFWGMSGVVRPHPRATLGVHRAIVFSSGERPVPFSLGRLGRSVIGITDDGFDNQVVSVSFRFRLPTEDLVATTLYGEWGADDTAGAWYDSPGIVLGTLLPVSGAGWSGTLGGEFAYFGNRCADCRRVSDPVRWYTHFRHTGGWVAGGRPLAHGLGGNGEELRVYASALPTRTLAFGADLARRDRSEFNLYAPIRGGPSWAAGLRADWQLRPGASARFTGSVEHGTGWSTRELDASFSYDLWR